jgi:hypothetical protein
MLVIEVGAWSEFQLGITSHSINNLVQICVKLCCGIWDLKFELLLTRG